MQCYSCNAPVRAASRFCPRCGRPQIVNERYRLLRVLGQGGFAIVYEAEDLRLGRRCAVKIVPVTTADEQRQVESEAHILGANASRLPFIPDIYDIWSASGQTHLVMEYIDGDTLDALPAPWPSAEVEGFLTALLTDLDRLHAAGIIHRDLKPANIKRTSRGYVLLDFGIAKQGSTTMRVARAASRDFAPIEQLRGQPTDARADLYSLAATAYFLLVGAGPPAADARLLGVSIDPPRRAAPQLSAATEAALLRMLALEPIDRPLSARAVLDSLLAASVASAPTAPVAGSPPTLSSSAGLPTTRLAEGVAPITPSSGAEHILVVAQDGSGDHMTISAAIAAALAGTRILVRPGRYEEGLKLDRTVEVVGDGPRESIVVASYSSDAVIMACDEASVRGLTLRCMAGEGGGKFFGVDIPRGRLRLEECTISSNSLACVGIHNHTADPTLLRCLITDCAQGGVYAYSSAAGTLEDCEIVGASLSGVEITSGARTTLRNCRISQSKQSGIYVWGNAEGLIEDCEIADNGLSNLSIKQGGSPTVRRCTMRNATQSGVFIYDHGGGLLEDCLIIGSGIAGLALAQHANPTIRRCVIRDGNESGIYAYEQAEGLIEACEIFNNRLAGVSIGEQANPHLRACRIHSGQQSGASIYTQGLGFFEECDIYNNALGGVAVSRGGNPTLRGCRIHSGQQGGVLAYNDGLGLLEDCAIFGNRYAGVELREGGAMTLRRCRIYDGQTSGIQVSEGGSGLIEACELYGNAVVGVMVMREGSPTLRDCIIRANRQNGVTIEAQGNGSFTDCQIIENQLAGVELKGGGAELLRCTISRNRFQAIYAHPQAEVSVTDCDLRGNSRGPWLIAGGAQVAKSGNRE